MNDDLSAWPQPPIPGAVHTYPQLLDTFTPTGLYRVSGHSADGDMHFRGWVMCWRCLPLAPNFCEVRIVRPEFVRVQCRTCRQSFLP